MNWTLNPSTGSILAHDDLLTIVLKVEDAAINSGILYQGMPLFQLMMDVPPQ
jgi:hypothetical protein